MTQDRKTLLALTALLLLSCALFLTWNAPQGEWGYILPLRGAKLAALLLVAYSVGVSTLLFQTLTNNPILTPSVLGFDALYVFLQTLLVFALGSTGYTQLPLYGKFTLELAAMLGGSLLLFSLLLRQGGRDLARMILIGVIFGVLFRSLSSLLQRMIDPEEFAVAQTAMFASFNTVNTKLLGFGGAIAIASVPVLWRGRHRLDVHLLGRDQVTNLGISYPRHTLWILAWIALLVATATDTAGIACGPPADGVPRFRRYAHWRAGRFRAPAGHEGRAERSGGICRRTGVFVAGAEKAGGLTGLPFQKN